MKSLNIWDWICLILVILGGLNWGLVGLAHMDFIATLFGDASIVSRVIYILVGLAALYLVIFSYRYGRR